jgi:hypothetical protein
VATKTNVSQIIVFVQCYLDLELDVKCLDYVDQQQHQ